MEHLSGVDALTNLSDRATFIERLVTRCRPEPPRGLGLLRLDVHRFASINSALGPRTADAVLKKFAARLRTTVPEAIDIARVSGDGFALLLPAEIDLAAMMDRLDDFAGRPLLVTGAVVELDVYMGAASVAEPIGDGYELMQAADIALALAQREPWRHVLYEPGMKADIRREYIIERDLRASVAREQRALLAGDDSDRFQLLCQPKASLRDGRLAGFETLMRWTLADGTPVPPTDFIPVAERCGLINVIGVWAMRAACRALPTLPDGLHLAVNVAPVQLYRPAWLIANIREALADGAVPPGRLELELTENALDPAAEAAVRDLAGLGLRIWIDDFGAGHSSLARLCALPFSGLKIDKSITDGMTQGGTASVDRLLGAVRSVAQALQMPVVIEGLEDRWQAERAREIGIEYGQGFLFGRPMPVSELGRFAESWSADGGADV